MLDSIPAQTNEIQRSAAKLIFAMVLEDWSAAAAMQGMNRPMDNCRRRPVARYFHEERGYY